MNEEIEAIQSIYGEEVVYCKSRGDSVESLRNYSDEALSLLAKAKDCVCISVTSLAVKCYSFLGWTSIFITFFLDDEYPDTAPKAEIRFSHDPELCQEIHAGTVRTKSYTIGHYDKQNKFDVETAENEILEAARCLIKVRLFEKFI